jgi:hypothetical protein
MAGKANRKEVNDDLLKEIAELKMECLELKQKIAIHAPSLALDGQPPEVTSYSDEIPKQILALGELGLTENEMIAAINVPRDKWNEFKGIFPEMTAALLRARDMALAAVDRMSRESLERRDWRFPFQNVERTKKILMEQGGNEGEGLTLVRVVKGAHPSSATSNRPALCPRCAADTAGSGQAADPATSSE